MADDNPQGNRRNKSRDAIRDAKEQVLLANERLEIEKESLKAANMFNLRKRKLIEAQAEYNKSLNYTNALYEEAQKKGIKLSDKRQKNFKKELENSLKQEKIQKKKIGQLTSIGKLQESITRSSFSAKRNYRKTLFYLENIYKYLNEQDKLIRSTTRQLGLGVAQSDEFRLNIEQSAVFAASLGSSVKDLVEIQGVFTQQTGRASLFSAEMLKNATLLQQGLGLSAGDVGTIAVQFERMGINMNNTAKFTQEVFDSTQRMGLSANRIMKDINTNMIKLQKYSFRKGVEGFAEMAYSASNLDADMKEILGSVENLRTLESAIKASANLQVLGGNFAQYGDAMSILFESRNDPEAFTKRIAKMTEGLVTLQKTDQGYEYGFASPFAVDLLTQMEKAIGVNADELQKIAFRERQLVDIRREMAGIGGINDEDRKFIENNAKLDSETKQFMVQIRGREVALAKLTSQQIKEQNARTKTLEESAKAAQTFDDQFLILTNQLKATLLPVLRGLNDVILFIRPVIDKIVNVVDSIPSSILKTAGLVAGFGIVASKLFGAAAILKNVIGGIGGVIGGAFSKLGGLFGGKGAGGKGGLFSAASAKGIAAFGAAALGAGAGIMLASKGISSLAESIKGLGDEQLQTLQNLTIGLGAIVTLTPLVAGAAGLAAGPLLAFGGAVLAIGAGVGVAAAGIGFMAQGIAQMTEGDRGKQLGQIALGFAGITASAALLSTVGLAGLLPMAAAISGIALVAGDIERVGNAFYNIATVLSGNKDDFREIESIIKSIASVDIGQNSALNKLSSVLSSPLQVQFADKDVALNLDVSLEIDGDTLYRKANVVRRIPLDTNRVQSGIQGK
jgi:hypothetical protein